MDIDIKQTIFADYETLIFDLDGTLWDCYTPTGESMGAYKTVPPYKRETLTIVRDVNKNIIRLQRGVLELLDALDKSNKNLGIVSWSEMKDRSFSAQPAVMLLKLYDIFKYFNYQITLKIGVDKSRYIKPQGKTLYIDDSQEQTNGVNLSGKADVLWRRSFGTWDQILVPKGQVLSFALAGAGYVWDVAPESFDKIRIGDIVTDNVSDRFAVLDIDREGVRLFVRDLSSPNHTFWIDRETLLETPPQIVT